MNTSRHSKQANLILLWVLILNLFLPFLPVHQNNVYADTNSVFSTAYITSFDSGVVDVVNLSDGTVQKAAITVGTQPVSAAVNPNGTQVFVANAGDNTVSVIDPSTNTVTKTVSVGTSPHGMAFNDDGSKVYVANEGNDTVSVIDTSSLTVTATISTMGFGPVDLVVVGGKLYIACSNSSTVDVADLSSNTVTGQINVDQHPSGLSVNPAGTRVYVANNFGRSVSIIDTSNNSTNTSIVDFDFTTTKEPMSTEVSPDGSTIYSANHDGTLSVIDASSYMVTATINVGFGDAVVGVSQDGTRAYTVNADDQSISVINTSTNQVISTISGLSD
ncbi:MAG: autotransporter adhesin, partial [Paenibacillaceae bacterium]|nr:autotransporter adhesin [Paenibacillaceae bacterium]